MSVNSSIRKEDYKKFAPNTKASVSKFYPLKVKASRKLTKQVREACFGLTRA